MTTGTVPTVPTARFGRRSTRGVMLGFSGPRVAALAVAIGAFMFCLMTLGGTGGFLLGLLTASIPAAGAFVRVGGVPAVEWAPVGAHWQARRAAGQTTFRARPTSARPAGTMALPGDAASLRFYTPRDGEPVCMIHDPWRNTLSAVLRVRHPAYVLLSPDDQSERVARWGRLQAALAASGTCAGLQVLEASIPDSGRGVREWYESHVKQRGTWAAEQYETLLSTSALGASTHRSTLTLSLDLRAAAGAVRSCGGGLAGAAKLLRGDMTGLENDLRQAKLDFDGWACCEEVACMVRAAYDPALGGGFNPGSPGANLAHAGPLAIDEHWGYLRHDSGYSTVLWVAEWPRVGVPAHFLHSLIFAPDVRKTFCLHLRPKPAGSALAQIRREKTVMEADRRQKAKVGQMHSLADDREWQDVTAREAELIAGHADIDFHGWLVVTAGNPEALRAAVKQVERAANQCACETRVLYGQQAQAFVVGALPVGRSTL